MIDIIGYVEGSIGVIATRAIDGCTTHLVNYAPPRVFAGVETLYYVFESEELAREKLGWDGERYNPNFETQTVVPESITNRQAKLVLLNAGMLDDAEAAIAGILDEALRRAVQIEWEYSGEFRRDWPALVEVTTAMGLTAEQVDALFVAGAAL